LSTHPPSRCAPADKSRRERPVPNFEAREAPPAPNALQNPANVWHSADMLDRVDFEPIFFAPFVSSVMKVEPAWIDYNGHLNMAYYNVLFDRAVDEAFELLGCGLDYVKTHRHSCFTAETHVRYLRLRDLLAAFERWRAQRECCRTPSLP